VSNLYNLQGLWQQAAQFDYFSNIILNPKFHFKIGQAMASPEKNNVSFKVHSGSNKPMCAVNINSRHYV